ncbi:hypothetical protein [Ectobacillus funiculus]|uniref:Uncharacterized protein n=1 Tax=Ectobacillus funiculus TaxID=137993 RepID=A0ABV5WFB5_9BACI
MAAKEAKHLDQVDKHFEQVDKLREKFIDSFVDYWQHYSSWASWQFWFLLVMAVAPLVILYFFIDRKKAMHIGFFGFNVHVWASKLDEIAIAIDLWDYKYKIIPYLQSIAALDASFFPVSFMLLYQWTLNYKKNYYIYATGLCVFFAFLFKPALVAFGIFHIHKGVHYWYLFFAYIIVMLVSKLITNIFIHLEEEPKNPIVNVVEQEKLENPIMSDTEQDE